MGNWFALLIFLIVVGGSVLRKILEHLSQQVRTMPPEEEEYEATPEEIREFLRSLEGRQAAGAEPGAAPQPRPELEALPPKGRLLVDAQAPAAPAELEPRLEPLRPAAAPVRPETGFPAPAPARARARPARRAAPARARRRPERETPLPRPLEQALAPAKQPAPEAPRRRGASVQDLRGWDLRQAVIWSEILGPPLSMRRRRAP